jgi:hypothetical protein
VNRVFRALMALWMIGTKILLLIAITFLDVLEHLQQLLANAGPLADVG